MSTATAVVPLRTGRTRCRLTLACASRNARRARAGASGAVPASCSRLADDGAHTTRTRTSPFEPCPSQTMSAWRRARTARVRDERAVLPALGLLALFCPWHDGRARGAGTAEPAVATGWYLSERAGTRAASLTRVPRRTGRERRGRGGDPADSHGLAVAAVEPLELAAHAPP